MNIYNIHYPLSERKYDPSIIAIGFFDGVHLGHQQVIKRACQMAKKQHLPCGIMTFTPHPKEVIGIRDHIDQITPLEKKLELVEKHGIDFAYVVHFSKEFASIAPSDFIEEFLMKLQIKGVVIGFDFTFGSMGSGTAETLMELSNGRYLVDVVEPFYDHGEKVSSTRIRDYLLSGKVADANRLLGRNYSFLGRVVHGDKRGRTIGFPTANLQLVGDYLSMKKGVYACLVHVRGEIHLGVMNIGYNPTFEKKRIIASYEVHIIDFNAEIYDEVLEVELIEFIRNEKKFDRMEALIKQIQADVDYAKQIMADSMI